MKKYFFKFADSLVEFKRLKVLVISAMLTALYVVSSLFLNFYMPWSTGARISFCFVFLAIAAMLNGPVPAMMVGVLGDVLGYLIAPHGAFSYGITVCTALSGILFGLVLYHEKPSFWRYTIAAVLQTVLIDALAKTFVLKFLYGIGFGAMFLSRIPTLVISLPEMLILLPLLLPTIRKYIKE